MLLAACATPAPEPDPGFEVVTYDRYSEERTSLGEGLAQEWGMTLVPPFDHPDVIAGQGTAALELHGQVPDLDLVLVPVGGGGLLSGRLWDLGRFVVLPAAEPLIHVVVDRLREEMDRPVTHQHFSLMIKELDLHVGFFSQMHGTIADG